MAETINRSWQQQANYILREPAGECCMLYAVCCMLYASSMPKISVYAIILKLSPEFTAQLALLWHILRGNEALGIPESRFQ